MEKTSRYESGSPISQMAVAVAFCTMSMAFVAAVTNQLVTGWLAVAGMISVGLFYLTIGIFGLTSAAPKPYDDRLSQKIDQRMANIDGRNELTTLRAEMNARETSRLLKDDSEGESDRS